MLNSEQSIAEKLLLQNPIQNAYALLRLRQGGIGRFSFSENSVCLWDKEHNKNLYSINSATALKELYKQNKKFPPVKVSLVSDIAWLADIQKLGACIQTNICNQLQSSHYTKTPPKIDDVEFGEIKEDTIDWMLSVYHHPELDKDFIRQRIAVVPSVAAYHSGKPIAFFMTHSAAELGPVYVDPAFRGSGLAEAIYAEMMSRTLKVQPAPLIFVVPENHTSKNWLVRMGCVLAPTQVVWFWQES